MDESSSSLLVKKICPICSKEYKANKTRLKYGRQTTCSRACSYRFRADNRLRADNLGRKPGSLGIPYREKTSCQMCGNIIWHFPSRPRKYCSPKCYTDGVKFGLTIKKTRKPNSKPSQLTPEQRSENARKVWESRRRNGTDKHSLEERERMRGRMISLISSGKNPKRSKLEDIVAEQLLEIRIDFIRQFALRGDNGCYIGILDFYIPSKNLAIEVNGTFWHADPRFYPDGPIHECQQRVAEKYKRKSEYLQEHGFRLIELWEHDIKNIPNLVRGYLIE